MDNGQPDLKVSGELVLQESDSTKVEKVKTTIRSHDC